MHFYLVKQKTYAVSGVNTTLHQQSATFTWYVIIHKCYYNLFVPCDLFFFLYWFGLNFVKIIFEKIQRWLNELLVLTRKSIFVRNLQYHKFTWINLCNNRNELPDFPKLKWTETPYFLCIFSGNICLYVSSMVLR